jgi:ferritin-like metal-binding protein YciE
MPKSDAPTRDAVIVKYLNEAYGKEKQLETTLTAQIGLAKRPQLKKGLQDHLKVTRAQSKGLAKRIKELGGKADTGPDLPGPDVAAGAVGAVSNVANRALALSKGPVQALRGTSEADNELRNVRDCLWNEAEEIAHYNVIEAVSEELGDRDTVKLARTYRRQEESMQRLLERQIPPLVKAVIRDEVPRRSASPRPRGAPRARRRAARRPASPPRARAPRPPSVPRRRRSRDPRRADPSGRTRPLSPAPVRPATSRPERPARRLGSVVLARLPRSAETAAHHGRWPPCGRRDAPLFERLGGRRPGLRR